MSGAALILEVLERRMLDSHGFTQPALAGDSALLFAMRPRNAAREKGPFGQVAQRVQAHSSAPTLSGLIGPAPPSNHKPDGPDTPLHSTPSGLK
jgi:hypothetical protein